MRTIRSLSRIDLITTDPERLAAFYGALGFRDLGGPPNDPVLDRRMRLQLGAQRADLVRMRGHGAPYPSSVPGWSPYFQHIAIVVSNMAEAYGRLLALTGWTPITTDGPQHLPKTSGGVIAFKLRDPEGHPLELIAFDPRHTPDEWCRPDTDSLFLGIDHSAISVVDPTRSTRFYEELGLIRTGGSLNLGPEQARLDDVHDPVVEVTALSSASQPTPHLELLSYRGDYPRPIALLELNDVAASRLVFAVDPAGFDGELTARDPDGHVLIFENPEKYTSAA